MTIATALGIYGQQHAPTTADPARIAYSIEPLLAWWSDRPVSYIKGETCRAYDRSRYRTRLDKDGNSVREKIAPGTTRRELQTLGAALAYCVKEGHLTHAPTVTLPEKPAPKERWLTRQEAAALIRAARHDSRAEPHLPLFILIGLYTGARRSAILSLQWFPNMAGGHVDLERGRIDFNAIGRRQTKKRRPTIPIPARLLTMLRYARRRSNRQYVLEYGGSPILNIRHSFATAVRRAKLGAVTPHTLRHTAATWLMQSGAEKFDAAGFLGMEMETLERVYAKHHPDHLRAVAQLAGGRQRTSPLHPRNVGFSGANRGSDSG
jgi:integrase